MKTIGQIIADLRSALKEVSADSMYSNRFLWSEFQSQADMLIKRDADSQRRIYQTIDIWDTICLTMIAVDPIMCDCIKLPTDCEIYRSAYKIPKALESSFGFIYRLLATPDFSVSFSIVNPFDFQVKTNLRYNKGKYAFFHNGYLWTNAKYPSLVLSGIFREDISHMKCDKSDLNTSGNCGTMLLKSCGVPDYLVAPAKQMVLNILLPTLQKTTDNVVNSSESQREVSL